MKQKKSHAAADAYALLEQPNKRIAGRKVVIATDQSVVVLASKETPVPADVSVDRIFDNMDDFLAKCNHQTVLAYHEQYLECTPPKKQDDQTTAFWLWAWFVKNGRPILDDHQTTNADGTKSRKSTIGSRVYTVLPVPEAGHGLKTPQAITCLRIVTEEADQSTRQITEEALKARIYARVEEIKTRQDAWRIFQYYRPTLIANHLLKHD